MIHPQVRTYLRTFSMRLHIMINAAVSRLRVLCLPLTITHKLVLQKQECSRSEMLQLESVLAPQNNFFVKRHRFAPIWGGTSLLDMILDAISDLAKMDHSWDFFVNLSESDFPIAPVANLEALLNKWAFASAHLACLRLLPTYVVNRKNGLKKTLIYMLEFFFLK